MQWLLERFYYDISNNVGNNNQYPNNADILLLSIYTLISFFNAIKIWLPAQFLSKIGAASTPTLLIIIVNIITLMRIDINLYIKKKDNYKKEFCVLSEKNEVVDELSIPTWSVRRLVIHFSYAINIVVIFFNACFGATVEKSLSVIVLVTLMATCINSLIDNISNRYEAVPKVYTRK